MKRGTVSDSRVRRFERLDFAKSDLAKPVITDDGYWKLDGKIARTGIQIYRDGSGNEIRELRLEDDVRDSLSGFALTPLTNGHPPGMVSPDNAKQYAVGAVGAAEYKDGWVRAPITVWSQDAIEAIKAGRAELSVGYSCELVMESGEYNGERYDAVQKNIKPNHLALVDHARAGKEARLRLDAKDAATLEMDTDLDTNTNRVLASDSNSVQKTERETMPIKFMVDGFEVEVQDANAKSAIERAIASAKKDAEDKLAIEKARADKADAELAKAKEQATRLQVQVDAANRDVKCDECDGSGKIGAKQCDGCGGKGEMKADALTYDWRVASRARSDERAARKAGAARAKLLDTVKPHISANEKLDDLSDLDIKRLTLKTLKIAIDGKDDVYVSAMFDVQMDLQAKNKTRAIDEVRTVSDAKTVAQADTDEVEMDPVAIMRKRNADAFVKCTR